MNGQLQSNLVQRFATMALGAACTLSFTACDDQAAQTQAKAQQKEQLPNIKVELPPKPNFEEDKAPEKWPDGSFSVYGLRAKLDENVKAGAAGSEVMVKGFVQEVYVPPVCPEEGVCPPGKQSHVWVTDHANQKGKKRAMMVVKYKFNVPEWEEKKWQDEPEVILEKGKQYTFKGKFKRFSDTGFSHDRGLVEFASYKVSDAESGAELWVAPPGSPWHPAEVARQEEQNQALLEKANKAKNGK